MKVRTFKKGSEVLTVKVCEYSKLAEIHEPHDFYVVEEEDAQDVICKYLFQDFVEVCNETDCENPALVNGFCKCHTLQHAEEQGW